MSKECPNAPTSGGGNRACFKCGKEGHISRECPNSSAGGARACFKCNGEGHLSRDCPKQGGGSRGCFNCGEEGHLSRDCTQAKKPRVDNGSFGESSNGFSWDEPLSGSNTKFSGGSGPAGNGGGSCRRCNKEGHFAKDCTEPRLGDDGKPLPPAYVPQEIEVDDDIYKTGISAGVNFSKYSEIKVNLSGFEEGEDITPFATLFRCFRVRLSSTPS